MLLASPFFCPSSLCRCFFALHRGRRRFSTPRRGSSLLLPSLPCVVSASHLLVVFGCGPFSSPRQSCRRCLSAPHRVSPSLLLCFTLPRSEPPLPSVEVRAFSLRSVRVLQEQPLLALSLVLYRRRRLLAVVLRRSVLTASACSSFAQPHFFAVRRPACRLVSVSVFVSVVLPLCSDCSEQSYPLKLEELD
ncbi:uncharacterized protein [Arachis hypogaea]|uniref:uncharacterized protein n=1 Tax=Arachis hypogaea TaxID=3818 RepID=UPI003B2233D3